MPSRVVPVPRLLAPRRDVIPRSAAMAPLLRLADTLMEPHRSLFLEELRRLMVILAPVRIRRW